MATVQHFRSTVAGAVPAAAQMVPGRLAINTADAKLYTLDSTNTIRMIGSADLYTASNTTNQLVKTVNGVRPDNAGNMVISSRRNPIINGTFMLNQYGNPASGAISTFVADRWFMTSAGATVSTASGTIGPQVNYLSWQETAGTGTPTISQSIDNCGTMAGNQVTVSLLVNASKAMTLTPTLTQNFGSGGSSSVVVTGAPIALTSGSWTRIQQTLTLPSVLGKTLGPNHYLKLAWSTAANPGTFTLLLTEAQLELGPAFMGYEYAGFADTFSDCVSFYEVFPGSPFVWTGQLGNLSIPQKTVQFAFKRTPTPTITFSNVTASGLGGGNPTVNSVSNNVARLSLPAGNLLLGGFAVYSFGMIVNAELPTA